MASEGHYELPSRPRAKLITNMRKALHPQLISRASRGPDERIRSILRAAKQRELWIALEENDDDAYPPAADAPPDTDPAKLYCIKARHNVGSTNWFTDDVHVHRQTAEVLYDPKLVAEAIADLTTEHRATAADLLITGYAEEYLFDEEAEEEDPDLPEQQWKTGDEDQKLWDSTTYRTSIGVNEVIQHLLRVREAIRAGTFDVRPPIEEFHRTHLLGRPIPPCTMRTPLDGL